MNDDDFTLKDYISGKAIPKSKPVATMIVWTCGVLRRKRGGFQTFCTRTDVSPNEFIFASTTVLAFNNDSTLPRQKAEEILKYLDEFPPPFSLVDEKEVPLVSDIITPPVVPLSMIKAGSICTHNDGQRHHMTAIVDVVGNMAYALFLTSLKNWNYYARKATSIESAVLGQRGPRESFLAPVVRPITEFYRHVGILPEDQTEVFKREFAKAFASGRV